MMIVVYLFIHLFHPLYPFILLMTKEGTFGYGTRSRLESFNPHPLFADSIQHCSSQSCGLCLHHRAEALCWIQSPSAPKLPARMGLALSRRTVTLPYHFFNSLRSPWWTVFQDQSARQKAIFASIDSEVLHLEDGPSCSRLSANLKDTFRIYFLSLCDIIIPHAEIACSLVPFSLLACKKKTLE